MFSKENQPNTSVTPSISHNLQFIALLLSAPLNNTVFLNSGLKYCNDWYCCQRTNISPSFMLSWCVCSEEKSGLCYMDWPYGLSERKIRFSCEQQHLLNTTGSSVLVTCPASSVFSNILLPAFHSTLSLLPWKLKWLVGPSLIGNPSYFEKTVLA